MHLDSMNTLGFNAPEIFMIFKKSSIANPFLKSIVTKANASS